jgi:hypothetical protein
MQDLSMFIFCLGCRRLNSLSRDLDKQNDGGAFPSFVSASLSFFILVHHFAYGKFGALQLLLSTPLFIER